MNFNDLSITFHTYKIVECKNFYEKYFDTKLTFDCAWYVSIQLKSLAKPDIFLSFMEPRTPDTKVATGGVTLNLLVEDVNTEYEKLKQTDITIVDEIADHDWGDRSFTVNDPIGNTLYIYSVREMTTEYQNAVTQ